MLTVFLSQLFKLRCYFYFFFFFSSRRRHTRCLSDWSSDVCSSDLPESKCEKPRSIVIPRRFSSGKRSTDAPVSAWTNRDLPWSIWPARQITNWEQIGRASCRERV